MLHMFSSWLIVALGWKIIAPTLQVWPLRVCFNSQLGTDHTLQRPLLKKTKCYISILVGSNYVPYHEAVATNLEFGLNWQ